MIPAMIADDRCRGELHDHQTVLNVDWPAANALQAQTSQGADADLARTRALAAYKDFLTLWKDADPDIPVLRQASRVREVAVIPPLNPETSANVSETFRYSLPAVVWP
jgi:hypothetical protein